MNNPIKPNDMKIEYEEEGSATFYINSVQVATGYYDFLFSLASQSLSREGDKVNSKELCKMFMSPQHAKAFNVLLTKNIKEYEQRFGEIIIPKEIFPPKLDGLK